MQRLLCPSLPGKETYHGIKSHPGSHTPAHLPAQVIYQGDQDSFCPKIQPETKLKWGQVICLNHGAAVYVPNPYLPDLTRHNGPGSNTQMAGNTEPSILPMSSGLTMK